MNDQVIVGCQDTGQHNADIWIPGTTITRYSLLVGRSAAPPLAPSLPSIHRFSGNLVMAGSSVAHFVHLHKITFIDATGPELLSFVSTTLLSKYLPGVSDPCRLGPDSRIPPAAQSPARHWLWSWSRHFARLSWNSNFNSTALFCVTCDWRYILQVRVGADGYLNLLNLCLLIINCFETKVFWCQNQKSKNVFTLLL